MITTLKNIKITAISSALPNNCISVFDYCNNLLSEREAKRLTKNTGFEKLCITDNTMTTADLCFAAGEHIFNSTDIKKDDIDGIVFVSQTPDYILPATSHVLQNRFGLKTDIFAIDINQGCSGYVYGLNVASQLVSTEQCKKVLLCAGDTISKLTNESDRASRTIFGDGASATIIEKGTEKLFFNFKTFGERAKAIIVANSSNKKEEKTNLDGYLALDGMSIMNFTLDEVPANIEELLAQANVDKLAIDKYVMHQANKLIINSLADKLSIDSEKIPFIANNIGNTSSASIPLVLSGLADNKVLKQVVLCGFGVGLSIASVITNLSDTKLLQTVRI